MLISMFGPPRLINWKMTIKKISCGPTCAVSPIYWAIRISQVPY